MINVQGCETSWTARTRYRGSNGAYATMQRNGASRQGAIDRLLAAIAALPGFDQEAQAAQGGALPRPHHCAGR